MPIRVVAGFTAEADVGGKKVEGVFSLVGTKTLAGHLRTKDGGVSLAELVNSVSGATLPIDITISDVLFAFKQTQDGQRSKYLFGLQASGTIDLANLPLAGQIIRKALPHSQTISIDNIQLLVASEPFDKGDLAALRDVESTLPETVPDGATVSARANLGDRAISLSSGTSGEQASPAPNSASPPPSPSAKPSGGGTWIAINKAFGPVGLERIGFKYRDGGVLVLLDASLAIAGITFSLQGLGAGLKIAEKTPLFQLDGLGLSFSNGPIEISGSLIKVSDDPLQLDGSLLVRAATFTLSAIGSYASLNGEPSIFAWAVLLKDLGGPSFFFVRGVAFGFGVNRVLRLPPIGEVQNFPLIQAAWGTLKPGSLREVLATYVSPMAGNFWIAAGVRFTSFELIESFALLSVSFGGDVEIGLLGISRVSVPKGAKPGEAIAFAELALRAVIRPADGSIQVEGRLTDSSYIFARECRITGGFAFCIWFSGPHAGDFVVTLGGYHPRFRRPAHYPAVPRLGIRWQVSPELSITGEVYYALTPSCFMAGGRLSAVFRSGPIEAWFTAYADFLLSWQPFYYQASMGISMGVAVALKIDLLFCSFTISLRVELGVDLTLWGPPFAGEARVSLWVISFTIRFGGTRSVPEPLKKIEFIRTCLPPSKIKDVPDVLSARITGGLLREQSLSDGKVVRIVSADRLSVVAQSVIPSTDFAGLAAGRPRTTGSLGIRPMGKTGLNSRFTVRLLNKDGIEINSTNLRTSTVMGRVPEAIWGKSKEEGKVSLPEKPEAKTIEAGVGIVIRCVPPEPEHPLPKIPIEKLTYREISIAVGWRNPGEKASPGYKQGTTIFNTILTDPLGVLTCLRGQSPSPFVMNNPDLREFKKAAAGYFQSTPYCCALGSSYE